MCGVRLRLDSQEVPVPGLASACEASSFARLLNMYSCVRIIVWISGSGTNNVVGQIPSELTLLTNLEYLSLGKSVLSFYFVHLCYEYKLIRPGESF